MKKTISTLCALALLVPVSAYAQNQNDRNDHNGNTHGQSTQNDKNSNAKKPATQQSSAKSGSNSNAGHNQTSSNKAPAAQKYSNSGHKFAKGQRFDRSKASNYRRIDYRQHRQLSAPPRGYVWVRAGNDALLVRLSNNLIMRIVAGIY
jgi:Ni/Co efflux regulator RcnB